MGERGLERVAVVEDGRLLGILPREPVVRRLAEDEPPPPPTRISSRCRRREARRPRRGAGQLRGRERGAVQQVVLADLQLGEAVMAEDLGDDHALPRRSPAPGPGACRASS